MWQELSTCLMKSDQFAVIMVTVKSPKCGLVCKKDKNDTLLKFDKNKIQHGSYYRNVKILLNENITFWRRLSKNKHKPPTILKFYAATQPKETTKKLNYKLVSVSDKI